MNCINTKSVEFQTKLKQSGLSEYEYTIEVGAYFNKQRRLGVPESELKFPELDQIDGANSSNYLAQQIKLKNNSSNINQILNYSQANSIEEANIILNDKHRDLEINILPLNETAIVNIEQRPKTYESKNRELVNIYKNKQALTSIFNKLRSLYGINLINTSIDELILDKQYKDIVDAKHTNAFVFNGDIYINKDVADIDAPLHEMTHILLGGIKFQDPVLYNNLINIVEQLPYYKELAKNYYGRTHSDINEEIFVTEFANYLSNKRSALTQLPLYIQEQIMYNTKRLLDSIFMGDFSVKTISNDKLFNMSLPEIAQLVNSNVFDNISKTILSNSAMHRILNNKKSDLIKSNQLKEFCK